ncbi:MAG TPA: matrixin family metalloprotease [Acetobacteraceae bacterium]
MNTNNRWYRATRNALALVAAAAASFCFTAPASAFILQNIGNCKPGQAWDTSRHVKVRVLDDSVSDYAKIRGTPASTVREQMDRDIDAVIELWNSVPGSRLVLERGSGISGDRDLQLPTQDNFGDQTIVIGFTDESLTEDAPAETEDGSKDGCTITRKHIRFRKSPDSSHFYHWTFGPPDTTDCDYGATSYTPTCKAFFTKDQPRPSGKAVPITFLGVLTHEMGHAVGLEHPNDDYAVMAQHFSTWLRGKNEVLHTQLLPDDIAGVLALYGKSGGTTPLDVSVSNTWYESQIEWARDPDNTKNCIAQFAAVKKASDALANATGFATARQVSTNGTSKGGGHDDLLQALAQAEDALKACEGALNAMQVDHCQVSSRADDWAGKTAGVGAFCGVNKTSGSAFPPASQKVCPGKQVQLRYTLNNHTKLRDVLVKSEVWFSSDAALNTQDGSDTQSPDIREFTLRAASSAPIGQVFRLPAKVPADSKGNTYVFVRAVPYDTNSGASLLGTEDDQWNNAIMVRHSVKVDPAACG